LAALESLASGTPVVCSETSAVGEFLLLQSKESVGMAAANNGKAFAQAITELLARLDSEQTLRSLCHHQADNFPLSSTISHMLSISPQKRLRVA